MFENPLEYYFKTFQIKTCIRFNLFMSRFSDRPKLLMLLIFHIIKRKI